MKPEIPQNHQHRTKMPHNMAKTREKSLEDFYANINDKPIYAGFKNKVDIHAGINGKMIFDTKNVWNKIACNKEKSPRRALYIHIPFCLARCKFCSFYRGQTNIKEMDYYANYIVKELKIVANSNFVKSKKFDAVYFGGGTPTDLSVVAFDKILKAINNNIPLTNDCEFTIEGRIHGFNDDKIDTCISHGVNRFSFGVQSFDTDIRRKMGRIETKEDIIKNLNKFKNISDTTISIDLIYGLPEQTLSIWKNDLDTAIQHDAIDSSSIYNLKFLPGSPILDMIKTGELKSVPNQKEQGNLFLFTRDYLSKINSKRLGLRHWSYNNKERSIYNFIPKYNYTVLPIGCGAGGHIGNYKIMQNMELKEYYEYLDSNKKPIKMAVEFINDIGINGYFVGTLEEFLQIDFLEAERKFNKPNITEKFIPLLEQWKSAGMITFDGRTMKLTPEGEFFNVNIAQNIIEYYKWINI